MKSLLFALVALTLPAFAHADVVNLQLGQNQSCDNLAPGSVIVISYGSLHSAITCGVGQVQPPQPVTFWQCYSDLYGGNGVAERVPGQGRTKNEAIAAAIDNCNRELRHHQVGACQTNDGVVGSTCEQIQQ